MQLSNSDAVMEQWRGYRIVVQLLISDDAVIE